MSISSVWRFLCCAVLLSSCSSVSVAQNTETKAPPVIDVHVHAMDGNFPGIGPMCPNTSKFTASDPQEREEPFGWVKEQCTPALYPSAPGEYMKDVCRDGAAQRDGGCIW
ncbi:MAG: hypothetical protein JOZ14_04350 [Acidobacteria bacterium]|nr:hypothetical protein [Acidobacteriota bacterium]